jgi:hypothetical protein
MEGCLMGNRCLVSLEKGEASVEAAKMGSRSIFIGFQQRMEVVMELVCAP